jgi:hypothetical protein
VFALVQFMTISKEKDGTLRGTAIQVRQQRLSARAE